MEKSKIVKYKGNDYVVGLTWEEINGDKTSIIRGKIRDKINRKKLDGFGVKIDANKTKVQVGFSNKKAKGLPSLAKIFASQEEFKDSLVIAKIKDDLFWTVGVTDEGLIVAGQDSLYKTSDFIDTIGAELQLSDDLKIFIAEDCYSEVEELIEDSLEDLEVNEFDVDVVLGGNHKEKEIDLVYNKNVDTLKSLGSIVGMGAILMLGYNYVYKEDPLYEEIVNQETSYGFFSQYNQFKKSLKKKNRNGSTDVNADNVEVLAKTEILKDRNSTYSKIDILNNFEFLYNIFDLYLVEWELKTIRFQNSGQEFFTVEYKRIDDSYGFKSQLESELRNILYKNGISPKNYRISYGNPSGNILLLNIEFKEAQKLVLNENANQDEIKIKKEEFGNQLSQIKKKIESLEAQTAELGFSDKRFGSQLEELESAILSQGSKASKIFKEIKKLDEDFASQEIEFDESLIGGKRADMLSMMQQYSFYSWSEGQQYRQYPKINSRSKTAISPYAKAYEFMVTPGGNMDVLGLKGLSDIILSDKLLNKNHVKIKKVKFNLSNETWEIEGETYEKI